MSLSNSPAEIGKRRIRFPVAAKIAFTIAGTIDGRRSRSVELNQLFERDWQALNVAVATSRVAPPRERRFSNRRGRLQIALP
jgi:hypothetical protein